MLEGEPEEGGERGALDETEERGRGGEREREIIASINCV